MQSHAVEVMTGLAPGELLDYLAFYPTSDHLTVDAPLDLVAEHMWGELHIEDAKFFKRRAWRRGLQRWYQLNYSLLDKQRFPEFPECLSEAQLYSFRVLREWWTAQYQPPEASLHSVLNVIDQCDEIVAASPQHEEELERTLQSLQLAHWPGHDVRLYEPDEAPFYNHTMYGLFEGEFVWTYDAYRYSSIRRDTLYNVRHEASMRAFCQQLSMEVYHDALKISQAALYSFPTDCSVRNGQRESRNNECHTNHPLPQKSLSSPPPLGLGPLVKTCRWLDTERSFLKQDMPYYLWDRCRHRTIATRDLDTFVDYTAVSHTWGRWTMGKPVKVKGVPWRVPPNRKFEVRKLGTRLGGLRCGTRYIWIDLFCIPQDGSAIGAAEIARQAQIFVIAKYAVAWLNDVSDFDCLSSTLRFMVLALLYFTPESEEIKALELCGEAILDDIAYKTTGLLMPREGRLYYERARVNAWFTSLWTLQELCLRPDMWICAADWKVVSVIAGRPMSLIEISVLWHIFLDEFVAEGRKLREGVMNPFLLIDLDDPDNDQIFAAFTELTIWTMKVRITDLTRLSRTEILVLGERRFCKSRRAEAIMSALCTTAWFKELPPDLHEVDLVLEKYPIAFLRELQRKDPAGFFGRVVKVGDTSLNPEGMHEHVWQLEHERRLRLRIANDRGVARPVEFRRILEGSKGTLLPFSQHTVSVAVLTALDDTFTCHESVRGWTINLDASVHIPTASILASTTRPRASELGIVSTLLMGFDTYYAPGVDGKVPAPTDPYNAARHIDLEAWVHSRSFEVHAVVVAYRESGIKLKHGIVPRTVTGVIIARLGEGSYIRLGVFIVAMTPREIPAATVTNWLIA